MSATVLWEEGPLQAILAGNGDRVEIILSCATCARMREAGWLGTFYVLSEQHQAGALARAIRLAEGHVCGEQEHG